jgi:hypothetical protein
MLRKKSSAISAAATLLGLAVTIPLLGQGYGAQAMGAWELV